MQNKKKHEMPEDYGELHKQEAISQWPHIFLLYLGHADKQAVAEQDSSFSLQLRVLNVSL